MSLVEVRKAARSAMRSLWARPEMIEAQDALRAAIEPAIEGLRKCAREGGKPITECYREVIWGAGIPKKFRELWRSK